MKPKKWLFGMALILSLLICVNFAVWGQEHPAGPNGKEILPSKQMIFVAHEDDDLLFMNPDLMTLIHNGVYIESVYVTSGDRGKGPKYWLGREAGIKDAYAYMANVANVWQQSQLAIEGKKLIRFTLKANPRINLIFLRLPDGYDVKYGETTLKDIWTDPNAVARTKDNSNTYRKKDLINVIQGLLTEFQPDTLHYVYPGVHIDHRTVAKFMELTQKQSYNYYEVVKYSDYTINRHPPNLLEADINAKWKVAQIYGKHDSYFPKFVLQKKYQSYYNWCRREYRWSDDPYGPEGIPHEMPKPVVRHKVAI